MPPKKSHRVSKSSKSKGIDAKASTSGQSLVANSDGPVFFWRLKDEDAYLSQWYVSAFSTPEDEIIVYQTAEQYMMYHKALLFSDPETASLILETAAPKAQKALGRMVKNFNEEVWTANRERIVEEGTYLKFKYGKETEQEGGKGLTEKLLATGYGEIVEASPMDRIWGIGFGAKNAEKRREQWGLNLLGKALMRVRERLRAEDERRGLLPSSDMLLC